MDVTVVSEPAVWAGVLGLATSVIGNVIQYWSGRADRKAAAEKAYGQRQILDAERRDRITQEDWDKLRSLVDLAREETESIRAEARLTRNLIDQIKTREQALAANEFRLLNENVNLTRRVDELEDEIKRLSERLRECEKEHGN